MYQYRQVLVRMRQGDSDRDIDRSKIMGRKKLAAVREIATERGWLSLGNALPDDAQLATAFSRKEFLPASCISSAEPWREQIAQWHDAGVPGTTIHSALVAQPRLRGKLLIRVQATSAIEGGAHPGCTDAAGVQTYRSRTD
jgi:hypothetical protein